MAPSLYSSDNSRSYISLQPLTSSQTTRDLVSDHTRTLESLGLADSANKVAFYQGDACNLDNSFTGYDLVLAANLIDRLYRPRLLQVDMR